MGVFPYFSSHVAMSSKLLATLISLIKGVNGQDQGLLDTLIITMGTSPLVPSWTWVVFISLSTKWATDNFQYYTNNSFSISEIAMAGHKYPMHVSSFKQRKRNSRTKPPTLPVITFTFLWDNELISFIFYQPQSKTSAQILFL